MDKLTDDTAASQVFYNTSRCDELTGRFSDMVGAIIDAYTEQDKRSKAKRMESSLSF